MEWACQGEWSGHVRGSGVGSVRVRGRSLKSNCLHYMLVLVVPTPTQTLHPRTHPLMPHTSVRHIGPEVHPVQSTGKEHSNIEGRLRPTVLRGHQHLTPKHVLLTAGRE